MKIRNNKPEKGNKFYNTVANGGLSQCVKGSPIDKDCDVLPNCVGYATGRFNEIIGEMKYPKLYCNAENFIEQAKNIYGLEVVDYPVLGGIMVFQRGNTLNGNDGAGHVFIVEKFIDEKTILTSESAWNGRAFYTANRTNENGRWGMSEPYSFRGCIVNPAIGKVVYVKPVEPVVNSDINVGDKVEVINPIVYGTENKFALYYDLYDVIEVKGDRVVIGIGNTVTAPISTLNVKKAGSKETLKVGDEVEVLEPLIYGKDSHFGVYYDTYKIMELSGDRAVIGVNGVVTSAININNIKRK